MDNLSPFQADILLTPEDLATGYWVQDRTHFGTPITPLNASFVVPSHRIGTRVANAKTKSPVDQFYVKMHQGYYYMAVRMFPGDVKARQREHEAYIEASIATGWETFCHLRDTVLLPIYRELERLAREPFTATEALDVLSWLATTYNTVWTVHFEVVKPRFGVLPKLESLYTQISGSEEFQTLYSLFHVMNKSLETDRELSHLAALVRQNRDLVRTFRETPPLDLPRVLAESPAAHDFNRQFQQFLTEYGQRTPYSHDFGDPTWEEDPVPPLTLIGQYVASGYEFERRFQASGEESQRTFERVMAAARPGPEKEAFLRRFAEARELWPIDEDHHFYLDAMLPAKTRPVILRVGEALVERRQIASPYDVFYLYRDEVEQALREAPLTYTRLAVERREELIRQRTVVPPPTLGTPPPDAGREPSPTEVRIFGAGAPATGEGERELHGFSASAGRYTGRVRLVAGPADFHRVAPGDVLVCRTTTPPWTMLFPIVGAIVTDAGGILSHCATVAREYGIPAVVGTRRATQLLTDGEEVTVDGGAGTVSRSRG